MKVFLTVATLVVVLGAISVSVDLEFDHWKQKHEKSYSSEEEEFQRKMIWMNNLKLVLEHNMLADQGLKTYRLGMNHFADMDNQEFQAMFSSSTGSFNDTETATLCSSAFTPEEEDGALPGSVDWRKKGYVTDVKNQGGKCGSCWAFSATGSLEGQMFRKTGELIPLSQQQLIDCSKEFGNHGCTNGSTIRAFKYIISSKGLEADFTYPYKAQDQACRFNPQRVKATCRDCVLLPRGNEDQLKNAVATVGPISVAIDASKLQLYTSGVFNEPDCSSHNLGHAVLLVGYGETSFSKPYWLVKNSWGHRWGEKGYIRMSRNKDNQCGIATLAVYPLV